jgi:UDP-N-acetylmuramyl tripeptide synthase
VRLFGVNAPALGSATLPHAADARLCPRCGARLQYDLVYYGHLGWYRCPSCDLRRPTPSVTVVEATSGGDLGSSLLIETPRAPIAAEVRLPGVYNVYNALAAVAACSELDIPVATIQEGLATFTAAFGRLERIRIHDREVFLALVKNPVGFTEVLRTILDGDAGSRTLVLAINDLFADGTDVSWLWDVEFERLAGRVNLAVCAGLRAEDMAVRLKYAGVDVGHIRVVPDLRVAVDQALAAASPGETVYVLPTYTAMLAVREALRQAGHVKDFWED